MKIFLVFAVNQDEVDFEPSVFLTREAAEEQVLELESMGIDLVHLTETTVEE